MHTETPLLKPSGGFATPGSPRLAQRPAQHLTVVILAFVVSAAILVLTGSAGGWINALLPRPSINGGQEWVHTAFFTIFCLYVLSTAFPYLLFLGWRRLPACRRLVVDPPPMVSVIIPAFNEQINISRSVRNTLKQDYPDFEVIVVDDGSNDLTPFLIDDRSVTFVPLKRNRGKSSALNAGIDKAKGDIIVISDSDSYLDHQALRYLVDHFADPRVGAVAGRVDVLNPRSLPVAWQTLEYILGQTVVKEAQARSSDSVMICPGPLSAIRRDLLLEMGGCSDRTLAEDFDLTLQVIARGQIVAYEPRAVVWTRTPMTMSDLRKQRLRWYRGTLQVFSLHRDLFLKRDTGLLGMFWLPYSLLVGFGGVLFEACLLAAFPLLLFLSGAPLGNLAQGLVFMLMIELLGISQYLIALRLSGRTDRRLVAAAFLIKPYHLFLAWLRLCAIWREGRKRDLSWNG